MEIPRELPDDLHPSETDVAVEALQEFLFAKATVVIDARTGFPLDQYVTHRQSPRSRTPAPVPKCRHARTSKMRALSSAPSSASPPSKSRCAGMTSPPIASPTLWTHHLSRSLERFKPKDWWTPSCLPQRNLHTPGPDPQVVLAIAWQPIQPQPQWSAPLSVRLRSGFGASMVGTLLLWRRSKRRFPVVAGVSVSLGLAVVMVRTPHRELPSEQLSAAATALHLNMYRSFDYTDRDTVYDSLALSVDGTLLDTVYEEIFASLVMRDEGSAVARVTSITHHDVTPQASHAHHARRDNPLECQGPGGMDGAWPGHALGAPHQRADRWSALFSCKKLPTDGGLLRACSKNEFPRIWRFPMSSEPVILLEHVLVERGNFCLEIPELRVNPGERVGIVAPSGQGKSTLLMVLAGLITPTRGHVSVNGADPALQPPPGGLNTWLGWGLTWNCPPICGSTSSVLGGPSHETFASHPSDINVVLGRVGLTGSNNARWLRSPPGNNNAWPWPDCFFTAHRCAWLTSPRPHWTKDGQTHAATCFLPSPIRSPSALPAMTPF